MTSSQAPYAGPRKLGPDLAQVLAYWEGLKRGEADMPFWDDLNLSSLPDLSGRLFLLEVSDKPTRFRFGITGGEIKDRYTGDLVSKFLDEIELRFPLQYLNSQSSGTVESRRPTYYHHAAAKTGSAYPAGGYSRLLLPTWGDGHIGNAVGGDRLGLGSCRCSG